MGPGVTELWLRLCWCDSGWWWNQLSTIDDANIKQSLAICNQVALVADGQNKIVGILEVKWKTNQNTNMGIRKQEIPLLEFCLILKNDLEVKESRPCQQCRLNNQHASDVWMIWVMDSIPWVRCASGNVLKFISSILSSLGAEYQGQLLRCSLKLLNISPYIYTPIIYLLFWTVLCCQISSGL